MNNQQNKNNIYLRMQLDISLSGQLHHEQIFGSMQNSNAFVDVMSLWYFSKLLQ